MGEQWQALLTVGGFALLTLAIFGGLLGRIRRDGGKVEAEHYGVPELVLSLLLAGAFVALIAFSVMQAPAVPAPRITVEKVLPNAFLFIMIAAGIGALLNHRGITLGEAFGLRRVGPVRSLLLGLGLIAAAFPLVLLAQVAMQTALPETAREQELVTLFREMSQKGDRAGLIQIFVAGAVIAPLCEEFLFRGFFYGVGKRYVGALASAILTSVLFAAFHVNVAALPSLFVLALTFTIAYEATGSLWVPVCMHAFFNAGQLGVLYLVNQPGPVQ